MSWRVLVIRRLALFIAIVPAMSILPAAQAAMAQSPATTDTASETIARADSEFAAERYDTAESLYREAIAMGSQSAHPRVRVALMLA